MGNYIIKRLCLFSGLLITFLSIKDIYAEAPAPQAEDKSALAEQAEEREELQYFLRPPFFRLPPLRIPIIRNSKLIAYCQLQLEMEAASDSAFDEAKIRIAFLRDAIFKDLYNAFATLWIETKEPKAEILKERAHKVANAVLGEGKIKGTYLRQMILDRDPLN